MASRVVSINLERFFCFSISWEVGWLVGDDGGKRMGGGGRRTAVDDSFLVQFRV